MLAIRTRLLAAGAGVLLGFVVLVAATLEAAFQQSARDAEEGRLRGLVYALLAAAEPGPYGRLTLSDENLPEPRLRQPQSELEAAILDESGAALWRSRGAGPLPPVPAPAVGRWHFDRLPGDDGRFLLAFGLRWIGAGDTPSRYTVVVLEDPESYDNQLGIFRRTLRHGLYGAAAGLLAILVLVLVWALAPLRQLVKELRAIESGAQAQIAGRYPRELVPLTGALNTMIVSERGQLTRHRNALGDLAHSLKTPLAVLRGLGGDAGLAPALRGTLDEQVARMQQIVDHQLARAATAGRRALAQPVAVAPVADRIVGALRKVYADRSLRYAVEVDRALRARVDAGDLHELLGNLLDNASKWAHGAVRLRARLAQGRLELQVDDDGPGFPPDPERLLARGARADTRVAGQGLGLAAVEDMVQAYQGEIRLERSDLGGARVGLSLPA